MITRTVLTALLACVGAALAWQLGVLDESWQVAGTLIAVVAGVLVAMLLTREDEPEPVPEPPRPAFQPPPADEPQPTTRMVLDVDTPAGGGQWWTQTKSAPQPSVNGDARPAPKPRDLAGYVDTARVVQCPRCGSFQIDVTRLAGGFSFRCRTDDHAWQWQPGRAWPATVVVSRRRNP
ncbi:hypothetical protein [Actinocrispum sp. NPDC049592]|uniref:hypothetical protein n=1 Tax=Actinocrispum sp. NPDC049592 TaxID=3154835 RepID=UPI003412C0AC